MPTFSIGKKTKEPILKSILEGPRLRLMQKSCNILDLGIVFQNQLRFSIVSATLLKNTSEDMGEKIGIKFPFDTIWHGEMGKEMHIVSSFLY